MAESDCETLVDVYFPLVPAPVIQDPRRRAFSSTHSCVLLDRDPNDDDTDYQSSPARTHAVTESEGLEGRPTSSEVSSVDEDMSDSCSGTTCAGSDDELMAADTHTNVPPQDQPALETSVLFNTQAQLPKPRISTKGASSFCTFLDSNHRQLPTGQLQKILLTPLDLPLASQAYMGTHKKGISTFPRIAMKETSVIPPTTQKLTSQAPRCPSEDQMKIDLLGIGAQFLKERQLRRTFARPVFAATALINNAQLTYRHDPEALLKQILLTKDTSNPELNAERLNDFLNGLDLIAENLLHRL
jgi:hypothetical protein